MMYTLASFKDNKVVALVTFDAITSLEEKWSASVTTQVVERGFNISDSVTVEPPTYSLRGVVTSYSIFDLNGEITWQDGKFLPKDYRSDDGHIKTRDQLISLISKGSIITLLESTEVVVDKNIEVAYKESAISKVREIGDCVITSLSISQPDASSNAFDISLELQKVILATVGVKELAEDEVTPTLTPYYSPQTKSGDGSGGSGGKEKSSSTEETNVADASIEEAASVSDEAVEVTKSSEWERANRESLERRRVQQEEIYNLNWKLNYLKVNKRPPEDGVAPYGPFANDR